MINFTIQSNYGIRHLNPNIQASNIEIFPSPENTGAPPASPRIKCQYPIKNRHVSNQAPQQTPKKKNLKITGASAVHDFAREISELAKSK